MQRTAKIFMNNRSQAVRLPKEFQFNAREVFIRKEGSDVILSPRPSDWSSYLAEGPVASENFMEGVTIFPSRRVSRNGALHAGHRSLLLHHEALERCSLEAAQKNSGQGSVHFHDHQVRAAVWRYLPDASRTRRLSTLFFAMSRFWTSPTKQCRTTPKSVPT